MKTQLFCFALILAAASGFADISVTADTNDQQWSSEGTGKYVNQTSHRIGAQYAGYVTGAVLPFLLPDLGGEAITNVTVDFRVIQSNIGNLDTAFGAYLDLVAPNVGTVSSSSTTVDDLSGTVLVDDYKKLSPYYFPNSTADHSVSGDALTAYLQGIYAADPDAAGKYVMLTLVPDTPINGGKYFSISSGDASANQPTLTLYTSAPTIDFAEQPTASAISNGVYAMTLGVATGLPEPSLNGTLALDGIDVTSAMTTGLTYTASLSAQAQKLIWTVTATNGAADDVVVAITNLVPSIYGTVPDQVAGLAADAGDGEVSLSWTAPSDNGQPITGYLVEVDTGSGFSLLASVAETNCLHDTAVNGTTYTYRVAATNALGAIGLFSAAVSGTPELFTLEPSFTILPTLTVTNVDYGIYDCLVTVGVASGVPVPTVSSVLTLNGADVTADVSNGTYTVVQTPEPQTVVWTVTASNGVETAAVFAATSSIPSSTALSITDFSRDRSIFDGGLAIGRSSASIPLSGYALPDTVLEARAISTDDGGTTSTEWVEIGTSASDGIWSGSIDVQTNSSWYLASVRFRGDTNTVVSTTNRFGVGLIISFHEQSNLAQQLLTYYNTESLNVSVSDPEAVQMIELEDRGGTSEADTGVPGPFRQINDENFRTTSLSHMAAQICEAAPGLKVLLVMDAKSGVAQNATLNDTTVTRSFSAVQALFDKVRQDGAKIGVIVQSHTNGIDEEDYGMYLCRSLLGQTLDGEECPTNSAGRYVFDDNYTPDVGDHIWAEVLPGLLTGRTKVVAQDSGYVWPGTNPAKHIFFEQWHELESSTNIAPNPFVASLCQNSIRLGTLPDPSSDSAHYTKDDYYGKPYSARQRVVLALEAAGIIHFDAPTFDQITWTPDYVQFASSAGPITTIANQLGLPELDTSIDSNFTEVVAFRMDLDTEQARDVRIVDPASGLAAASGVVRVYPNSGTFDESSTLYFRALSTAGKFGFANFFLNEVHLHKPVVLCGPEGFEAIEVQPWLDNETINYERVNFTSSDADADGLPDEWEATHFSGDADPGAVVSNAVNTVEEAYVAGLDPNDPLDLFTVSNGLKTLRWNAVSGRVYTVWSTTNLLDGFQTLETNILWPQDSWTNTGGEDAVYYRLDVEVE